MKKTLSFFFIFLLLNIQHAFALNCGKKLVELGDKKVEVLIKCGEPVLEEKWQEKVIVYHDFQRQIIKGKALHYDVEEWTYNFGSNRFLYFLRFVNGKLSNIEEGFRGYDGPLPLRTTKSDCGRRVEVGDRKIDVLLKCGRPTFTEKKKEDQFHSIFSERDKIFEERQYDVTFEEWTYNLGPNNFIYFIEFENGKVRKIESGDYGY